MMQHLSGRLLELEQKREKLESQLATPAPAPFPSLRPNLAEGYRRKVERLEESLNEPEIRLQAGEIIRTIIDKIEVGPANDTNVPQIAAAAKNLGASSSETKISVVLYDHLAAVIELAESKNAIDKSDGFSCVAGTRYPLYRKTIWLRRGRLKPA